MWCMQISVVLIPPLRPIPSHQYEVRRWSWEEMLAVSSQHHGLPLSSTDPGSEGRCLLSFHPTWHLVPRCSQTHFPPHLTPDLMPPGPCLVTADQLTLVSTFLGEEGRTHGWILSDVCIATATSWSTWCSNPRKNILT